MELKEAIQTLKDFAKYGRYYSNNTEHHMKTAINTVLSHLTKQEKMIEILLDLYWNKEQARLIIEYGIESKEQLGIEFDKIFFEEAE